MKMFHQNQNKILVLVCIFVFQFLAHCVVSSDGSSPRLGSGSIFLEGPGLGLARARCQSPGACEGLFRMKKVYSFAIKNIKIWSFGG